MDVLEVRDYTPMVADTREKKAKFVVEIDDMNPKTLSHWAIWSRKFH